MKRDIIFVQEISSQFPTKKEEFGAPKLALHMRIVVYNDHRTWSMDVEIIQEFRETIELPGEPYCKFKTTREVVFSDRISGEKDDFLLAKSALSADDDTATEIMHRLYWKYILQPSLEIDYDGSPPKNENWFKIHAHGTWDFHTRSILLDREEDVKQVQSV